MPKIVDKEKKRTQIALTAMELFAQKGFENTSIRQITGAAGIGKGTLYDYFQDKEDILTEIADIMIKGWRTFFASAVEGKTSPQEIIQAIMNPAALDTPEFRQMFLLYLDLGRIKTDSSRKFGFTERFNLFLKDSVEELTAIIDEGKKSGMFSLEFDSRHMGVALLAFIDGVFLHHSVFRTEFDLVEVWKTLCRVLFRGLSK